MIDRDQLDELYSDDAMKRRDYGRTLSPQERAFRERQEAERREIERADAERAEHHTALFRANRRIPT